MADIKFSDYIRSLVSGTPDAASTLPIVPAAGEAKKLADSYYGDVKSDASVPMGTDWNMGNIRAQAREFREDFHDYGTVSSGILTPDQDTYGAHHVATVGGNITIEVPSSAFSEGKICGVIELLGADAFAIAWGANWDFGSAGVPIPTATHLFAYERKYGDTKTKVWERGGFV